MTDINLITYNVRGLRRDIKRRENLMLSFYKKRIVQKVVQIDEEWNMERESFVHMVQIVQKVLQSC